MAYVYDDEADDAELSLRFAIDVIANDGVSPTDLAAAINATNPEGCWRVSPSEADPSVLTVHSPLHGDYTRWGGVARSGLDAAAHRAVAASKGGLVVRVYTTTHLFKAEEVKGVLALFLVLQSHFQSDPATTRGMPLSASIAASCPGADSHSLAYQLDRVFEVADESDRATIMALKALVNAKPVPPGYQVDAPDSPVALFTFRHHRATLDPEAVILWVNDLLKLIRAGRSMRRRDIDDLISRGIENAVNVLLEDDGLRRNGSDNSQNDSDADGAVRDESQYVEDPDSDPEFDHGSRAGSVGSHLEFLSEMHIELNDDSDGSDGSDGSGSSGGSDNSDASD